MRYKCKECGKFIKRESGQWKTNFRRFMDAKICRDCFYGLKHKLDDAKELYNKYRRVIYPNDPFKW